MPDGINGCNATECDRAAVARGMCLMHYKRWRRKRDPNDVFTKTVNPHLAGYRRLVTQASDCSIHDCDRAVLARGLCDLHYGRLKRHGDPLKGGPHRGTLPNWTKGLSKHPLYATWQGMKSRCRDSRNRAYKHYGGRGIYIDPRWNDFTQFVTDMGERPTRKHTIERIDNDGPYSPENCRWGCAIGGPHRAA